MALADMSFEKLRAEDTGKAARFLVVLSSALAFILSLTGSRAHADTDLRIAPGATFEWVLSESGTTIPDADIVDVDLFDTPKERVAELNAAGKKTICYISVGTWEDWRPDKDDFPAHAIGKPLENWDGEKWLDISNIAQVVPLIRKRFDLCKEKGFWGIEPDNMDLHEQDTGFNISRDYQISYSAWVTEEAHLRGLSVGMKNAADLLPELLPKFDWALVEDCFSQERCKEFSPMIAAGKAVFAVEFTSSNIDFDKFCAQAKEIGYYPLLKKRELGKWTKRCG